MSLRAIPDLRVLRPADGPETAGAWDMALRSDGPSAIILSRQNVPVLDATDPNRVAEGAYAVVEADAPDVILIGTGSEVAVCVDAAARLADAGVSARVVSMPCWEAFEARSSAEQRAVIDPSIPRVSLEAGVTIGWHRWADTCLGIDRFGASAPGSIALDKLGINPDAVVAAANELLADRS